MFSQVSDASSACLFLSIHTGVSEDTVPSLLPFWRNGTNHVIVNLGEKPIQEDHQSAIVVQEAWRERYTVVFEFRTLLGPGAI